VILVTASYVHVTFTEKSVPGEGVSVVVLPEGTVVVTGCVIVVVDCVAVTVVVMVGVVDVVVLVSVVVVRVVSFVAVLVPVVVVRVVSVVEVVIIVVVDVVVVFGSAANTISGTYINRFQFKNNKIKYRFISNYFLCYHLNMILDDLF
jgi:hypothetical protein